MTTANAISLRLQALQDDAQAANLSRFFKTGEGQYGEGDRFLGLKVPQTRAIVKQFAKSATLNDVEELSLSPWHEERLAALLLLISIYNRAVKQKDESEIESIIKYYLSILPRGNNWDLVDLIAPKILGNYLVSHQQRISTLYTLAESDNLWGQRVAIVATYTLIHHDIFTPTERLATHFINHKHDLIHKATGWMLREIGKRDMSRLRAYLDKYAPLLPRTALRYAIERMDADVRSFYMLKKNC
jgi:3-methyladenine DNA glycosylase AlkD